jgi:hypothetical protein
VPGYLNPQNERLFEIQAGITVVVKPIFYKSKYFSCHYIKMFFGYLMKKRLSTGMRESQRRISDKIHADFEFLTRRLHLLGWEKKSHMLYGGGSTDEFTSTIKKGWWTAQRAREFGRDLFKLRLRFPEGYCQCIVKTTGGRSLHVVRYPSSCSRSNKKFIDNFVSRVQKVRHVTITDY